MILKNVVLVIAIALSSIGTYAQTKIIAHRGFSNIAPENTLIAFQKAIECKADYFELDVRKTKDGSVVVIHDLYVNRTSSNNSKGKVSEMYYSEIATVKVGYSKKFGGTYENEKIPTLREALELAKGKIKVCIEIKEYGMEKEVLEIVNDLEMKDEVILFSFYYPVLAKIRMLDKNIRTLFLIDKATEMTIDYATVIEANAIGVGGGTILTKQYLDFAHNYGLEVWKWTVNDENKMQHLMDIGLDGLITNFPDKALLKINLTPN